MPSAFNTDATYFANLTKDYSVYKHGEFDAKWSVSGSIMMKKAVPKKRFQYFRKKINFFSLLLN
jgi:hypothetical protein